ncbi:hypothetical protein [Reinekea thalattae]|uniref:Uncharacterized protein n=1 Tax=Reinekea thalattae TaxID=2593301 RepID=A0A5C8ZAM6_9GAMM|nr:hypothetical protein [Reinekea thalattae]TXR53860.1 hypothetical protein FME95_04700 [Reinekea thalattae]
MSKVLLSLLLAIIPTYSFGNCVIEESIFSYERGSEYTYTLFLNSDSSLIFHHERWKPGNANEAELLEYFGIWSCDKNKINFQVNGNSYEAVYERVGQNPVGISSEAMSLKVEASNNILGYVVLLESGI